MKDEIYKKICMIKIFAIWIMLILASCLNRNVDENSELKQRVTRLEQIIDSLINRNNSNSAESSNLNTDNASSYGTTQQTSRCQAITKKGTQCKRKARTNGYCWQHGG